MTAYGYPQRTSLIEQMKEARERRKKVLDAVRKRRAEVYKQFLAKRKAAPSYS